MTSSRSFKIAARSNDPAARLWLAVLTVASVGFVIAAIYYRSIVWIVPAFFSPVLLALARQVFLPFEGYLEVNDTRAEWRDLDFSKGFAPRDQVVRIDLLVGVDQLPGVVLKDGSWARLPARLLLHPRTDVEALARQWKSAWPEVSIVSGP